MWLSPGGEWIDGGTDKEIKKSHGGTQGLATSSTWDSTTKWCLLQGQSSHRTEQADKETGLDLEPQVERFSSCVWSLKEEKQKQTNKTQSRKDVEPWAVTLFNV